MSDFNTVLAKIERYREKKTDTIFDDFFHDDLDLIITCIDKAKERTQLVEDLKDLRDLVWGEDIPSPTVPEYVEHHNSIQKILKNLDKIITELDG